MSYTAVVIGQVTQRKGARFHLDITGRAHCGAGAGIILTDTRAEVDATSSRLPLCRRCAKALRLHLTEAAELGSIAAADALYWLTPAPQAADQDAALLASIRGHLAAVWAEDPDPTWDEQQARRRELLAA